ncbi:DUF3467 domain-containing protein [Candidatus Peregrinibacteria bacterium]|nr:MAG: DUF3467 domain-containing protein [Candidatus Peregrinibacteria bacterium]
MTDQNPIPQGGQAAQQGGQPPLQVKVPDEVQKGVYSNAVSVNVNSNEVVLDFGYLLPNTPAPVIEVVSRVNMNQRTAESFLSVLAGAIEDFKKKQAQQQAQAPMGPAPMPGAALPQQPGPMGPAPMGPAPMGGMPQQPMGPAPMPGAPMGPAPMPYPA